MEEIRNRKRGRYEGTFHTKLLSDYLLKAYAEEFPFYIKSIFENIEKAKHSFPEIKETDVTGLNEEKIREMMENKLLEVLKWKHKWFGE